MFTFDKPITIGTFGEQREVSRLEIAAISLNLQSGHVRKGNGVLSIVFEDPDSGWQHPVTYTEPSVLEFIGTIKPQLEALLAPIWQKLQDDGKLPAGTVDVQIPQETSIDAAVQAKLLTAQPAIAVSPVSTPPVTVAEG